ncbi:MAG: MFS transporter, partial [Planctomycetota bacterium]
MLDLIPIGVLLAAITVVVMRLPRVDVGHTDAYRFRRVVNWLPLGLCYAFLYMGRYNVTVSKDFGFITESQFGNIFTVGSWVYGVSFLLNGPLTDKFGGRRSILLAASGAATANVFLAIYARSGALVEHKELICSVLYGLNMYFQSFGAVAVVKVNASWFHVRERGTFGGIFGILISLGLYFAYDWGAAIGRNLPLWCLFAVPAAILYVFWALCFALVRDNPSEAGHRDFDAGDASSGETGPRLPVFDVARRMLTSSVMLIIMVIEFCSGFLRNAIMHWYRDYAKGLGAGDAFVAKNWGLLLCIAGIMGGMFAGTISDRMFQSRRAPVSAVLYGIMIVGALVMMPTLDNPHVVGWTVVVMSMAVIGVHGMLSGTASADFGGKKNAGVATGIIDGFVYLGAGLQSLILGHMLPQKKT